MASPEPTPRIPVRTMAQDLERAMRTRQGQGAKPAPTKQTKEPERLTLRSLEAQEEDILAPYRQKKSSLQEILEKENGQDVARPFGTTRIMPRPPDLSKSEAIGYKSQSFRAPDLSKLPFCRRAKRFFTKRSACEDVSPSRKRSDWRQVAIL